MNSISIDSLVYRRAEEYARRCNLSVGELVERALSALVGHCEADVDTVDDPFAGFSGDWGGCKTAHEIADDLRAARNFTSTDEIFA